MQTNEYKQLIRELKCHGKSRNEIAEKLRRHGFSTTLDQSTLARWEKAHSPTERMIGAVKRAVDILRKSSMMEIKLEQLAVVVKYLRLLQSASNDLLMRDFDLMPIVLAVSKANLQVFSMGDLLGLIEISVAHHLTPSQENINTLLGLFRARNMHS